MYITLDLDIPPKAIQSTRFGGGHCHPDKQAEAWKKAVSLMAASQLPSGFKPYAGAVVVTQLEFVFRVTTAIKKKFPDWEDGEPVYKSTKSDIDNLQKGLYDALAGIVYIRDQQIVQTQLFGKIYGTRPHIFVEFRLGGVRHG
jgi:Holliday junction resolvase RusA-like endonuclease